MSDAFIYTRSLEIVISILSGLGLCYLGSRLFLSGLSEKSDLKFEYGKLKLHLFKATPGIFFSLFGSAIILSAVWNSASFSGDIQNKDGSSQRVEIRKSIEEPLQMSSPASVKESFDKAVDLHQNGDIKKAEALYYEILQRVPLLGDVANNLSDIQRKRGEGDKAFIFASYATLAFPDSETYKKTLRQANELLEQK